MEKSCVAYLLYQEVWWGWVALEQANPCALGCQCCSSAFSWAELYPQGPDSDSKELLQPFCLFLGGVVTLKRCGKGFVIPRALAQLRGVAQSLQAALQSPPSCQMQSSSEPAPPIRLNNSTINKGMLVMVKDSFLLEGKTGRQNKFNYSTQTQGLMELIEYFSLTSLGKIRVILRWNPCFPFRSTGSLTALESCVWYCLYLHMIKSCCH